MKKLIIILLGICLFPMHFTGQEKKQNATPKKLETQIIKEFKAKGKYKKIINDTLFTLTETGSNYKYQAKPVGKKFNRVLNYNKNTLTIESEYLFFINMYVSIKWYDKNGILTKKINYEEGFENLTLNDFIETVKKKLKIDLNKDQEGLSISRYITKIPEYHVNLYDKTSNKMRTITINGNDGSIISDEAYLLLEGD